MASKEIQLVDDSLKDAELFARAYAQWVAVKSGDERIQASVDEMRNGKYWMPLHWGDEDFESIASAFEKAFTSLGRIR